MNRNTLLHLSCDVKPEWPNEDDESKRNPPNQIEGRPNCRNGPERQQGIESRRCDETDRTPPPTTTFCRSIARSIAHAWKHAAPHRDVLPLNASSTETLLHDNNAVEQQCWTLITTSFVPRTELSSSTNNTTTTTNAADHVLAIMEALPPTPYEWLLVLEHESPEAVVVEWFCSSQSEWRNSCTCPELYLIEPSIHDGERLLWQRLIVFLP